MTFRLSFAAREEVTSSCSCWSLHLCCADYVHTQSVGPISKRGSLHFATRRQLYGRSPRFGSALMMLQPLSFVDNGQSVVLQALGGPLLKFPAPLTSPTKNPPIVLLMGCQDRPGELNTNALTVTSCPRLGTRDSDVGGNRYTSWNLWHQGLDNFENDLGVVALASLRLRPILSD